MYERAPVVALRNYLTAVVEAHPVFVLDGWTEEMRQRVWAVVDELSAEGWPPERVIVAVKKVAEDVGLRPSRQVMSATKDLTQQDAAVVHMVRWCIERYYGIDGPPS
jgi:hypothetical protein